MSAMTEGRARILLVDDERANLVALEAVLAPLDQELVLASTPQEALRQLLRHEFALVLLDVRMPIMDGLEVATLIRSRETTHSLPIIFLTAYGEAEEHLQQAYRLGAADFIFKPIDPDFLRAKVGVFVELHRQRQRTSELLRQAEAVSRAKSEFLRMAAHELRSPLAVVIGWISMIDEGTFGEPPEEWRRPLAKVAAKSRELAALVNDILAASQLEADASAPVPRRFDLAASVREAVLRRLDRVEELQADVAVEPARGELWVHADPHHVARILDDLLDNALTYNRSRPWVRFRLEAAEDRARLSVEDNGIGIPQELTERVFERFFRIDDPALATRPGTGLGLYIAREMARRNRGWLELVASEPDRGSTLALTLPLAVHADRPDGGSSATIRNTPIPINGSGG